MKLLFENVWGVVRPAQNLYAQDPIGLSRLISQMPQGRPAGNCPLARIFILVLLLTINYKLSTINCFAQSVSSTELIEHAKEYNNKVVEYEGEVIGDVMARGDFAWVNLNDGKNAIGVWGRKGALNNVIRHKGDYNYRGDTLLIKGVFRRACPEHGGDLDIHADKMTKVKDGFFMPHPIRFAKLVNAVGLGVVALGLAILCAFRARRK